MRREQFIVLIAATLEGTCLIRSRPVFMSEFQVGGKVQINNCEFIITSVGAA